MEWICTWWRGLFCLFDVPLTVHLSITLGNDQFDTQIFQYIYYNPLHVHVSSNILLILRRSNCINTASGIVTLSKWPSGAPDGHLLTVMIPDAVLTLNLLTWRIMWTPNNASRWQMGFNSAFKGLIQFDHLRMSKILLETCTCRGS
jgi:hypothetical protein